MARNRGSGEMEPKAVTTRPSSTANFLIDSVDRPDPANTSSGDFLIVKKNSIFNGFFNRMAVQEVLLDWGIPNISEVNENDTFTVEYDDGVNPPVNHSAILPTGFYTVEQALDTIVSQLNISVGLAAFVITAGNTGVYMGIDQVLVPGGTFEIVDTDLSAQIFGRVVASGFAQSFAIICPRILPYFYLDIVSTQLTYNQELKDADTSEQSRDVLYRWYFAWDTETSYDGYGFPVLQGYRSFVQRRLIAFPKQIRWNSTQPVGNLTFQVYDDNDDIVDPIAFSAAVGGAEMEFQMTLLLSED